MQDMRPSGSNMIKSVGVHPSNIKNSESEVKDYPLKASRMKDLNHPLKPFYPNESDVNVTIHSNEATDEEDYHNPFRWKRISSWGLLNFFAPQRLKLNRR